MNNEMVRRIVAKFCTSTWYDVNIGHHSVTLKNASD